MNALDILILAVVLAGFVKGLMCGFFRQVVSIVGFLAGLWVAFMLYSALGDWIAPYIGSDVSVGRALGIHPSVDWCSGRAVAVGVYVD